MKLSSAHSLLVPLLCASFALATMPLSSVKKITNLPVVPNKFIIEVATVSDIPDKRSMHLDHERVYADLKQREVGFEVNKEFNSVLFVGAVVTLSDADDVTELKQTQGIKSIRPVRVYPPPDPVKLDVAPADYPPDLQNTHILTGVDKLHEEGITGGGVTIGIIDTGIDYTHPALGGGFGPGFKVIGGWDFVGDNYTGGNTPVPDPDPLDQCVGHGTHVAGILGANPGNPFDISGVAYSASIQAYRIFGCQGDVSDDIIIDALIRAYDDNVDVLTLSLGGTDGWTEGAASVVASRIADTGKVVTIAAGNSGAAGAWFTSGPGNGIDVISVASLDNTAIPLQNATVHGAQHDPITYYQQLPLNFTETLPIYATSTNISVVDDACNALPDSTPDLSSFVVIVRRGTCTFVQKMTNIWAKGARVALIYDNYVGFVPIDAGNYTTSLIQAADGEWLVSEFVAGVNITISFPQAGASTDFPITTGGLISSFSSYGPSNDFYFKPAVTAPGGGILSTLPVNMGSYGLASGTSMATPFVAGSAALLISVKGKSAAVGKGARTLFETTAKKVGSSHTDGDPWQTVAQQGAGLINVYDAIHTTTIVSPGELILNDTANFKGVQTFSVTNSGSTAKTYTLTNVPAGTASTVEAGTIVVVPAPVPLTTDAATIALSHTTLTLAAGETQTITATFTPPSGLDASTFPVYSGFIEIANGSDITHVTYLGLAASLRDKRVLDNTSNFFGFPIPAVLDSAGNVQANTTKNYTFVGTDYPSILFRFAFGTPDLRIDLVSVNGTTNATLSTRDLEGPAFTFPQAHKQGSSFAQVTTAGSVAEYVYLSRNDEAGQNPYYVLSFPNATFADGTDIPKGSYKVMVRGLRVTGDLNKEEDYDSWLSPSIVGVV